ncbi:MAG TPA: cytochrome c [Porticoccaceae bacterium]|nr:cytochrome c [Porticoccaceae bacterium]
MNNKVLGVSGNVPSNRLLYRRARFGFLAVALGAAAGIHAAEDGGAGMAQGRADYLTYCASCHGANGEGDGPVSGSLKNRPPNLTYLKQQEMSGEFPLKRVTDIIQGNSDYALNYRTHGPADMPVWGKELTKDSGNRESLAQVRIQHLAKYLESIQQ